ncbi:MAG: WcaI family glycosyltransferase [Salibacteraceae bacterium]
MTKPSITLISLNYAPEDTAIGLYSSQMAAHLVRNGWKVQVVAGFPYYPNWEIAEDYQNKPNYFVEELNGVKVHRYKQFVPKDPTFINRSIQIVDFTLGNWFHLGKLKKTDVVISIIPYTSSSWLGNKLAKKMKAKHWIHIQDFEFDAAFESGLTTKKGAMNLAASALFKLEKSILDKADLVSTISNGMLRQLESKTTVQNFFFPNWVDEEFINPNSYEKHPFLNNGKFNVLYSGNIGGKQDWDLFVRVVKQFEDNKNIQFVIVGAGATRDKLANKLKNNNNVSFHNPVPYSDLNNLLCSADLHVLFQKNDVVDTVMPSKILGMMASSVPSLVTGNSKSEVCSAFETSSGGFFIGSGALNQICNVIHDYSANEILKNQHGINARKFVLDNFTQNVILERFSKRLNELIEIN